MFFCRTVHIPDFRCNGKPWVAVSIGNTHRRLPLGIIKLDFGPIFLMLASGFEEFRGAGNTDHFPGNGENFAGENDAAGTAVIVNIDRQNIFADLEIIGEIIFMTLQANRRAVEIDPFA